MMKYGFLYYTLFIVFGQVPVRSQTPCHQGDALFLGQHYAAAADVYLECVRQDTSLVTVRFSLAYCYDQLGDWSSAKTWYHGLEYTQNADVISRLAMIYDAQQNTPKAIKYYKILETLYPNNPQYPRKLGSLYLQGHEPDQAYVSFQRALEIAPKDVSAMSQLAEMKFQQGDVDAADSLVRAGIFVDSSYFGLYYLRAKILYRKKQYSAAATQLMFLDGKTDLPLVYNNLLGYSLIQTDSFDKAVFYLRRTLQKEPKNEYALFYLGLAFEKKKDFDEAQYFFQEAAKAGISENMHLFYHGMARIFNHQKNYKEVIRCYEKSLEYEDQPDIYLYLAGAAESAYQNKNKAISYYQKFLDRAPEHHHNIALAKSRIDWLKEQKFMKQK